MTELQPGISGRRLYQYNEDDFILTTLRLQGNKEEMLSLVEIKIKMESRLCIVLTCTTMTVLTLRKGYSQRMRL